MFPYRLLLALLAAATCFGDETKRPPNIVLIFTDDLGWKDTGFNNTGGLIETPNLDRLRSQGKLFPQAYSAAGNSAFWHLIS